MKYFLSYFKPHWKLFAADLLCAAFIAVVDLFFPMLTRYSINTFLAQAAYRSFFLVIACMIGMYLVRTAAQYFVTYFGHMFGARVETDMRADIFAHIEKQSFRFFDNHRTGQLMSRITNDLFEVTELAHHGPEDVFISVLTITGSFILMLSIRWELTVVMACVIPFIVIHIALTRRRLMNASKQVKEKTAAINTAIESSISGVRVTKTFTNEAYENIRFGEYNREYYGAKKSFYRVMAFFSCHLDFFTAILNVILIACGGILIMQNKMNLADLIAATLFTASFLQPIRRLTNFVEQYTTGMAGFKRFTEIMSTTDETKANEGAVAIESAKGDIVYKNVKFAYNNDITVLDNVNLSIGAGQTIAFVGPSGSGKTTLCSLLARFYELKGGSITLDGRDIKDISVDSLRKQIGFVQQDVFLFAGTIKGNIAYGKIGASDKEIEEAARRAEIHDDIIKMSDGYNTIVGERGIRLSGGQKQRVSIARTFLKNPPILILDEATSALDTATEIKIQQSFEKLAQGRTTLVIAHRLSTVRNANLIVVVNDEGIFEQGTHEQLLAANGLYTALYQAQMQNGF